MAQPSAFKTVSSVVRPNQLLRDDAPSLYVDDFWIPAEHIETIDMERITAVVTFPGVVYLFTGGFAWTPRR